MFINYFLKLRFRFNNRLMLNILLILSVLTNSAGAQAYMNEQTFDCTIIVSSPQKITQGILREFTLQNNTENDVWLLSWYTPFEGFLSNLFIIIDSTGKQLGYEGRLVKRSAPASEDYIKLSAKEKNTIQLDLTQGYQLPEGTFSLQLKQQNFKYKLMAEDSKLMNFHCDIEIVTIWID